MNHYRPEDDGLGAFKGLLAGITIAFVAALFLISFVGLYAAGLWFCPSVMEALL